MSPCRIRCSTFFLTVFNHKQDVLLYVGALMLRRSVISLVEWSPLVDKREFSISLCFATLTVAGCAVLMEEKAQEITK